MDLEIRQRFAEIQNSIKWPIYLFDFQGTCIDANNLDKIGERVDVPDIANDEVVKTGKFQWISVGSRMGVNTYYIALLGSDDAADGVMQLIRIMFKEGHKEMDRQTVLRTMLFDQSGKSYSIDDIESLGFIMDKELRVTLIDHKGATTAEAKVICENIIDDIIAIDIDRQHIAVIDYVQDEYELLVEAIISEMNSELMIPATAGIGKVVSGWTQLHKSYISSQSALTLGKKLGDEVLVHKYDQMMIYHLINEIDARSRYHYFNDFGVIFKDLVHDEELIQTAIRFFENDLNITETSRQLYVHRNTLIYRLNKIEKMTGLDLRSFDDAIQFYMLMLIWRLGDELKE